MYLIEIQFAWFFTGTSQLDYEKLVSSIRQKINRQFVSPATIIPLPHIAPPEIPRVQLQTSDNSSRIHIAQNRADFFASSLNTESQLSPKQLDAFFSDILLFSEILLTTTGIVRLGLVGRIYQECSEPAEEIANKLLKRNFSNLQSASVKIVERHVTDKFAYNDSYQFDEGLKQDTQSKILIITRDINTAPELPLVISMETIKDFSALSKDKLDTRYVNQVMEN